jgi:hypothetical protein
VFWVKRHNRLLPIIGIAIDHFGFAWFPFAVLGVDLHHLYLKKLFHSPPNIKLIGLPIDLKRISVATARSVHTFFGNQWAQNDLMWLKLELGFDYRFFYFRSSGHHYSSAAVLS